MLEVTTITTPTDKHENPSPISPPTSSTPIYMSTTNNYSLFDSSTHWLPLKNTNPMLRKHSVQVDGDDFPANAAATTDYWRRSSAPNIASSCTLCFKSYLQLYNVSCGQHQFCRACLSNNINNYNNAQLQATCPLCTQHSIHTTSTPSTNATFSGQQDYVFSNAYYPSQHLASYYPCAKLTNIPWDVSQNDVRQFFGNCRIPPSSASSQSIHIMMDRTTGKTLSDAYVEFASVQDLRRAVDTKNQKPLKGRVVSVSECCQEELLKVVFPKWRGQFQGISAIPPSSEVMKSMTTAAGGGNSPGCPPFITREEINSMLVVCKNYKLHFSRKCAERPFENIISVIAKYPWHQTNLVSTMHRDHIYEMLKLAIESLKTHLAKDYVQIDTTLLERLVRAGIMCPAFTERQKTTLLQASRMECPQDIVGFLIATNATTVHPTSMNNSNAKQQLYSQQSVHPWEIMSEEDDLLFTPASMSPISSIIRDIQKNCSIDDTVSTAPPTHKQPPNHIHPLANNGIPLLLQPISSQLELKQRLSTHAKHNESPWPPSFKSKSPSDIWRMKLPVESSKSLLTVL